MTREPGEPAGWMVEGGDAAEEFTAAPSDRHAPEYNARRTVSGAAASLAHAMPRQEIAR